MNRDGNIDETLDRVRAEVAEEVAAGVRVPAFAGVLARRARRRRLQAAAGGAALVVVAAGVVGGVAATRPGAHHSVPPAATVTATQQPTASSSTAATSGPQTYPPKGASYVVVDGQGQFLWTDLDNGTQGHFGLGGLEPSVSADGRRIAFTTSSNGGSSIEVWNLDTRSSQTVASSSSPLGVEHPSISPDGTHVAFLEIGAGIRVAKIGSSASPTTVVPNANVVTWSGNGALIYLLGPRSDCAVEQTNLSNSATRCLLPTATLQSLPAPNGAPWYIQDLSSGAGTGLFVLDVMADANAGSVAQAVAILDPAAEATPFHVLSATVSESTASGNVPGPGAAFPHLLGNGTRVVFVRTHGGGDTPFVSTVLSASVGGGSPTTVMTGVYGVGLGATSG